MGMVGKAGLRPWLLASTAAVVCMVQAGSALAQTRTFDVPAEPAAQGIPQFGQQAGIQVLSSAKAVAGKQTNAVKGDYSVDEGLAILLKGTGLEAAPKDASGIVTIRPAAQTAAVTGAAPAEDITQVVVTGTHIQGANPTSPVHVVSRQDIERSGYSTVGDVLRSLPENFSGGQNPGVLGADGGGVGNHNQTGASTVNLRGLGTDATLLLVNGHRLSSDGDAQASDISGIPLSAIQRIEVVPDGASALYGSDAVAGVVNIILKKAYSGLEVSGSTGVSSDGGGTNRQGSILGGFQVGRWFGMANLEDQSQDAVEAKDRALTSSVTPQTTLIPNLRRRSLYVNGGSDLNDAVTISLDGLISDREMEQTFRVTPTSILQDYTVKTPALTATANLDARLGGDWKLHFADLVSGSRNSQRTYYPSRNTSSSSEYRNSTDSLELTADGTAISLPSGPLKVAFGAGTRHETFNYPAPVSRRIDYAFGEALVPLITPSSSRLGLNELELNASARTEHYSTIGNATDPKIGLRYVPITGLTLRASWGKSFKAPTFLQMYSQKQAYLINASDLGYGSTGTVLTTVGGNPDLKPEKSTSWTLSADYSPPSARGLSLSADYFDIHYTDRVTVPTTVLIGALSTSNYSPFVDSSPSAATVSSIVSSADEFANISSSSYDPTKVLAIFDDSYVNATSQTETGFDIGYRDVLTMSVGTFSTFANATFVRLEQQLIPTSPTLKLSGTIFNLPKTKVRAGFTYERDGFAATLIGNYISSETDTGVTPNKPIASWTTADLTLGYTFASGSAKGLRVALSASNLFDRRPPTAYSPAIVYGGLNYDSTNASILGRYTSLTVTKAW